MQASHAVGIVTCLWAASAGWGQGGGQATWLWDVTTQDGDAVVEPGETATVTLSIDMEPDVGEEMVLGFGAANWDILGKANAGMGAIIDWGLNPDIDTAIFGTSDGVSIFDMGAGQFDFDTFIDDDPIEIMWFEWQPTQYTAFDVSYSTETQNLLNDPPGTAGIWVGEDVFEGEVVTWPIDEAAVSIAVVPAPASVALAAGLLFAIRRSRNVLEADL